MDFITWLFSVIPLVSRLLSLIFGKVKLNLARNKITRIPHAISSLVCLKRLKLFGNVIKHVDRYAVLNLVFHWEYFHPVLQSKLQLKSLEFLDTRRNMMPKRLLTINFTQESSQQALKSISLFFRSENRCRSSALCVMWYVFFLFVVFVSSFLLYSLSSYSSPSFFFFSG